MSNATDKTVTEQEIIKALELGPQPTTAMTWAFGGNDFSRIIKKLHSEGKVEKYRSGWILVK